MPAVVVEREGAGPWVRIQRPEVLGALDERVLDGLDAAVEQAAADPDIRELVVTGTGRGFCAGVGLSAVGGAWTPVSARPSAHGSSRRWLGWRRCRRRRSPPSTASRWPAGSSCCCAATS